MRLPRLGWRAPAQAWGGPDAPALRAAFGDLQRFMTWPHFEATLDAQAVSASFTDKTITAVDDPYQLVRSNNRIQPPRDFDSWLFVGEVAGVLAAATPSATTRYLVGWRPNGANLNYGISEVHAASGLSVRVIAPIMVRMRKDDYLTIGASVGAGNTSSISSGRAIGYFLPLT